MTVAAADVVLAAGWLGLLLAAALAYRRFGLARRRFFLAVALSLGWISFAIPNLIDGDPFRVDAAGELAAFAVSAATALGAIVAFVGYLVAGSDSGDAGTDREVGGTR